MDVLAYQIPPFKTVAWVSDEAKKIWRIRFQKIEEAIIYTAVKNVSDNRCSEQYLIVEGAMYFKLLQLTTPLEIEVEATFLGDIKTKGPIFYEVLLSRKGVETENRETFCCANHSRIIREKKLKEMVWQGALQVEGYQREETTIKLFSKVDTSVFWSKLFTMPGTQHRCSLSCKEHENYMLDYINAMKEYGYNEEAVWLQEIYCWPIEWCASHGICELRTPIVKVAYDTDATGVTYTIQIDGTAYPDEGAPGKRFPYRKRSFLRITDSKSFKAGLHHGS